MLFRSARVSDAAALDGVNVPVNKMPLAWTGLNPGCGPNMASSCFKISSLNAINFSSFGRGIVSLVLSLTHPVRCPAQLLLLSSRRSLGKDGCHAIAFGDGGSRRKSDEGGSSLACHAGSSRRSRTKTEALRVGGTETKADCRRIWRRGKLYYLRMMK